MSSDFEQRLAPLRSDEGRAALVNILHGLERETLRVLPDARLAQTPHPQALGKALTHPYITTDYSEALMEFITPVHNRIEDTFSFLKELHQITNHHIGDEALWAGSMPAKLESDELIPIAQYGTSNSGKMKSVYRAGLWHRYGKAMQTIAGLHYNFSLPDEFWQLLQQASDRKEVSLQQFRSAGYFTLIRNFKRYSWLLMYLFGASPVVHNSFFYGREIPQGLEQLGEDSWYLPYATSLRMSGMGYTNDAQSDLRVCYNCLNDYIATVDHAVNTLYPPYAKIGVKKDGEYLQLNDNILQIENEYYSNIRPKRVTRSGEKPRTALRKSGVEYIEVRCLDLNPFEPLGIKESDAHFLDVFLIYAAIVSDKRLEGTECDEVDDNYAIAITEGRKPGVVLHRDQQPITLKAWGTELIAEMQNVAQLLDEVNNTTAFTQSLIKQQAKLDNIELTPSQQVLTALQAGDRDVIKWTMDLANQHKAKLNSEPLSAERLAYFDALRKKSETDQAVREESDTLSFDDYLTHYFQAE